MNELPVTDQSQMARLAAYLLSRREALLNKVRTACETDTTIHSASTLSREEFNDHMPTILNILEQHLLNKSPEADAIIVASEHGLHRWHKGYQLQELLKEMEYLREGLITEIGIYWNLYPHVPGQIVQQAYQQAGNVFGQVVQGSVIKYNELEMLSAAQRAESLQQALDSLGQLEQERGGLLRMTSHDLRSGLGIVHGAAQLMNLPNNTDEQRQQMLDMMQRNLSSVRNLLQKLSDLARLEADQEALDIESFDASLLLRSIIDSTQPLATGRGILLQADGPEHLLITSDPIKVQRIVQNLLLNALEYTLVTTDGLGWVSVSWTVEDDARWTISVQDSGPGLPPGPANLLAANLAPSVETSSIFQKNGQPQAVSSPPVSTLPSTGGEGLGLHIVKRLCQVLRANLDVEIKPGAGTLFRVRFPKHLEQ